MKLMLLPLRSAAAVTLLTASFVIAFAPASSAVTQVDIACDTGASKYICIVSHDALSPHTITWRINGVEVPSLHNKIGTGGLRSCTANRSYDIQVDVIDSTGTVTGSGGFICNPGAWP